MSLNDEPCMITPILIDLNLFELKSYRFLISLDKCNGSCNVSNKTKDTNGKVFNMKTQNKLT